MRRELRENIRGRVKQQLLDRLLAANPIEVPRSLVDDQVREMQIDTARRIGAKDASQAAAAGPVRRACAPARRARAADRRADQDPRTCKLDRQRVSRRGSQN